MIKTGHIIKKCTPDRVQIIEVNVPFFYLARLKLSSTEPYTLLLTVLTPLPVGRPGAE